MEIKMKVKRSHVDTKQNISHVFCGWINRKRCKYFRVLMLTQKQLFYQQG